MSRRTARGGERGGGIGDRGWGGKWPTTTSTIKQTTTLKRVTERRRGCAGGKKTGGGGGGCTSRSTMPHVSHLYPPHSTPPFHFLSTHLIPSMIAHVQHRTSPVLFLDTLHTFLCFTEIPLSLPLFLSLPNKLNPTPLTPLLQHPPTHPIYPNKPLLPPLPLLLTSFHAAKTCEHPLPFSLSPLPPFLPLPRFRRAYNLCPPTKKINKKNIVASARTPRVFHT